eukprot:scaffold156549_cov36-Tisochrysis_lutea.AAC.2
MIRGTVSCLCIVHPSYVNSRGRCSRYDAQSSLVYGMARSPRAVPNGRVLLGAERGRCAKSVVTALPPLVRQERWMSSSRRPVSASFQKRGSAGLPFMLMLLVRVFMGIVVRTAPRPSPVRQNHAYASSPCVPRTALRALR